MVGLVLIEAESRAQRVARPFWFSEILGLRSEGRRGMARVVWGPRWGLEKDGDGSGWVPTAHRRIHIGSGLAGEAMALRG